MALSKSKKGEMIDEVSSFLAQSKLTVAARYSGTSVKAMQELRKQSKVDGTVVRVVKNRLFIKALQSYDKFKDLDTSSLTGQLFYAFNPEDDVAPARNIADFAKQQPQIEFVVGVTADGTILGPEDLGALASLPSKEQLRAQTVGTIAAPLSGLVGLLSGNLRGMLNVLTARSEVLETN